MCITQQWAAWPSRASIQQSNMACARHCQQRCENSAIYSNAPCTSHLASLRSLERSSTCFHQQIIIHLCTALTFRAKAGCRSTGGRLRLSTHLGKDARCKGDLGKGALGSEGGCGRPGRSEDSCPWPSTPAGDLIEEPAPTMLGSQELTNSLPLKKRG